MILASYACHPGFSRGRRIFEEPAPTRSDFQRDRDRIVHSTAFRRLVYKTQVFLNHEGDLFRTRLTHSLEVAQLGRSIARTLHLNEDLVEAIALAHDIGHTPFGHAGQDALNAALKSCNPNSAGFEHNMQSLRMVDTLEARYPEFEGLNLTFETREGILKHCSTRNARLIESREPGGVAQRHVNKSKAAKPGAGNCQQPSLEAQLANLADEIAYNAHDIDDGVRSGLLGIEQLQDQPLFSLFCREALQAHPQLSGRRLLFESIRRMLSAQVVNVMEASQAALRKTSPADVEGVRRQPVIIAFTPDMALQSAALKQFLFRNLYRHPQVMETTHKARQVVSELFGIYTADPMQMIGYEQKYQHKPERKVADYIASMTDRFAIKEHKRLMGISLFGEENGY